MADYLEMRREGSVALVLLNRPEAFNAFDHEHIRELAEALMSLAVDPGVRAVVLGGRGKAFCAGGDLKWALAWPDGPPAAFHILAGRLHQAVRELRRMPKPVIAAMDGVAAGAGVSMALACDFRVMAKGARLVFSFPTYGLSIDGGGTFTLPRLVGLARALQIAAFDQPISSDQALDWGLVGEVVEDGGALARAGEMAEALAAGSVHSFAQAKRLMTDSFSTDFETQLERERAALVACGRHPDGQEGLGAFSGKRKPKYI